MDQKISLPVLIDITIDNQKGPKVVGGPASFDTVRSAINKVIEKIDVDKVTLHQCLDAASVLASQIKSKISENHDITPDELSMKFAISSTGKVGFLGTGMDIKGAVTFEIKFKVKN
ncbi:Pepco domain-containing protein [Methylomagnum ishizawai]|uniref:Pepco domain-containing protein n=1 Tax=Methylomagnum ishizawai TaxID=1760988 RepID=UPI001C33DE68|nr:hypothetical protein [Methylomagnum ishizawai]BBL75587.1 hypothetical protein MishRS11D_26850 [Methylomagnum ishizawai]